MFSKRTNEGEIVPAAPRPTSTPLAADVVRKGPRIASLIGDGTTIDGDLSSDGELHIDGLVRGDLKIARLTIGESGRVEGSVTAEVLDCRGKIAGQVIAKEVRLYSTARVDGDITHDDLAIEAGAWLQGRVQKIQRQPTTPVLVETVGAA